MGLLHLNQSSPEMTSHSPTLTGNASELGSKLWLMGAAGALLHRWLFSRRLTAAPLDDFRHEGFPAAPRRKVLGLRSHSPPGFAGRRAARARAFCLGGSRFELHALLGDFGPRVWIPFGGWRGELREQHRWRRLDRRRKNHRR